MNIKIRNFLNEEIELKLRVGLYTVKDFMGKDIPGLAIVADCLDESGNATEQFSVLTKSFGEHIGLKNCAYMDLNNCPFGEQLLELGVAQNTGFTKQSGFCTYPLYHFDESFLKDVGGSEYETYSQAHDKCNALMSCGDEEIDEINDIKM